MSLGRRTITLLVTLALVGLPALALHALCVGRSCEHRAQASADAPFCSLPSDTRRLVAAGYYEGRSPEVLAVARRSGIASVMNRRNGVPWPALGSHSETRVPLGLSGAGIHSDASIPTGTTLDSIAPTVAEALRFKRPFPEVRSGRAVPGVATGEGSRLVLQIVLEGAGSRDLRGPGWPNLTRLLTRGPSTMDALVGSLPADPAAVLTTIGTGGPPRQHGITGGLVRNDEGELVAAFSDRAPVNVISTLGDDLDEKLRHRPRIGLVAPSPTYRGAIGGIWYVNDRQDDDDVVITKHRQIQAARTLIDTGYGRDSVPDILVAVLDASDPRLDAQLSSLVAHSNRAAGGASTVVVTGTGSAQSSPDVRAEEIVTDVSGAVTSRAEIIEAAAAGGLFVNQRVLARRGLSEDALISAMNDLDGPRGGALLADTFTGISVSFARYC